MIYALSSAKIEHLLNSGRVGGAAVDDDDDNNGLVQGGSIACKCERRERFFRAVNLNTYNSHQPAIRSRSIDRQPKRTGRLLRASIAAYLVRWRPGWLRRITIRRELRALNGVVSAEVLFSRIERMCVRWMGGIPQIDMGSPYRTVNEFCVIQSVAPSLVCFFVCIFSISFDYRATHIYYFRSTYVNAFENRIWLNHRFIA